MSAFRPSASRHCNSGDDGPSEEIDFDLVALSEAFDVDAVIGSSLLRAWNIDRAAPALRVSSSKGPQRTALSVGAPLALPPGPSIDELSRIQALLNKEAD